MTREELRAKAIEVMMDGADAQPRAFWRGIFDDALNALGAAGFKLFGPDVESINAGDLTRKPK
jgi:hypothetical protein